MDVLPDEVLGMILGLLSYEDRMNSRLVCRRFFKYPVYFPFSINRANTGFFVDRMFKYSFVKLQKKLLAKTLKIVSRKIFKGDSGITARLRNPRFTDENESNLYIFSRGIHFYEKFMHSDPAVRYILSAVKYVPLCGIGDIQPLIRFINLSPFVEKISIVNMKQPQVLESILHPERIRSYYLKNVDESILRLLQSSGRGDNIVDLSISDVSTVDLEIDGRLFVFPKLKRFTLDDKFYNITASHYIRATYMPNITELEIFADTWGSLLPLSEIFRMHTLEKMILHFNLSIRGVSFENFTRLKRLEIEVSEFYRREQLILLAPLANTLEHLKIFFIPTRKAKVDISVLERFTALEFMQLTVEKTHRNFRFVPQPVILKIPSSFFQASESRVRKLRVVILRGFDTTTLHGMTIAVTNANPFHPTSKKHIEIDEFIFPMSDEQRISKKRVRDTDE
jgi:hypothetical protein